MVVDKVEQVFNIVLLILTQLVRLIIDVGKGVIASDKNKRKVS